MIDPVDFQPLLANPLLSICGKRPSNDFAKYVELIWTLPNTGHGAMFDILPDSHFDLVFLIGDSHCTALLAGPYTRQVHLQLEEGWELVSIRFRPGIAPRLADAKPSEMINGGVFLSDVLGRDTDYFGEQLKALPGIRARKVFLEKFFRKSGLVEQVPQCRSRRCIDAIESRAGMMSVAELSRQTGMSVRTLERIFMEEIGLTPKRVLRYFRYQWALGNLRRKKYTTQADLAYECGYSDQSHFIKDFHFFSGRSPGRF